MATFSVGQIAPYGERSVIEGAGFIPDADDSCLQCQREFEIDTDSEDGVPVAIVTVPVESSQGNFCSKECEAKAFYADADEDTKANLRKMYLGAMLLMESLTPEVLGHLAKWDNLESQWFADNSKAQPNRAVVRLAGDLATMLSPEGGEDVAADVDAFLMPDKLYIDALIAAGYFVVEAEGRRDRLAGTFADNPTMRAMVDEDVVKATAVRDAMRNVKRILG